MKSAPISRKTIIFIIIVLILALVYFYFAGGETPTDSLLTVGSGGVGAIELSLLNQMESLEIDTTLFKDSAYVSLIDYSVAITPQNVGRPNPFAPVPGVPNPFATEAPAGSAPPSGR